MILRLPGTELAKVLCRLGDDIREEFELDATEGFSCSMVQISTEFRPDEDLKIVT